MFPGRAERERNTWNPTDSVSGIRILLMSELSKQWVQIFLLVKCGAPLVMMVQGTHTRYLHS